MKIGQQVRLLCLWARHLTELPLPLSGKTGSNRWQLDSKTEKVTSLFPGRSTLTNNYLTESRSSIMKELQKQVYIVYRKNIVWNYGLSSKL